MKKIISVSLSLLLIGCCFSACSGLETDTQTTDAPDVNTGTETTLTSAGNTEETTVATAVEQTEETDTIEVNATQEIVTENETETSVE